MTSGSEEKDYEGLKIKSILTRCDVIATERKKGNLWTTRSVLSQMIHPYPL